MNKEFIPYEQALALKELGFDELVEFYKDSSEEIFDMRTPDDAPCILWQQVFRWFRENYGLHSQMSILRDDEWHYSIRRKDNKWTIEFPVKDIYSSYEEGELACLRKLIEIAKSKSA